ncbi:hypothetical protein [Kocuria sp. HSID16901]|nr:hypothetical protein [Kocuria sp. HSID16901]
MAVQMPEGSEHTTLTPAQLSALIDESQERLAGVNRLLESW